MGRLPFVYLEILIGGDSRNLNVWCPMLDRIKTILSGSKSRNLSLDDRLVLLMFVLSSLLVYFLSFFKALTDKGI
ncbi:transmembrane protein, putative [Medicago truncatula]|uniref:Transmembrane protein, putative n=1 Tax=Medicago truncatula TaxID=3880 RepID=G7ZY19_MEDTR|nr:transmembrane protein, putative [Medicago truncatula]